MLFVTTGANGSGKNVITLEDVRTLQLKTGRPVCYSGFKLLVPFGWKEIDPKKWEDEPDGTIFLFDEAQNVFPPRQPGSAVPQFIRMLAEHRHRGFDFFIVTPHPRMLDIWVRSIVGTPGWHRHLKPIGLGLVSVLQWNHMHDQPQKPGSGGSGETSTRRHNKEVYTWYESASLHTAKPKLPRAVYVMALAVLALGVLAWQAYVWMGTLGDKGKSSFASIGAPVAKSVPAAARGRPGAKSGDDLMQKRTELALSYIPVVPGFVETAPRYEKLTAPLVAPFAAACISGKLPGEKEPGCKCWTQQATLLADVPRALCEQIAQRGYFMDWQQMQLQTVNSTRPGREGQGAYETPGNGAKTVPGASRLATEAVSPASGSKGAVAFGSTPEDPVFQASSTVGERDGQILATMKNRPAPLQQRFLSH